MNKSTELYYLCRSVLTLLQDIQQQVTDHLDENDPGYGPLPIITDKNPYTFLVSYMVEVEDNRYLIDCPYLQNQLDFEDQEIMRSNRWFTKDENEV